MTVTMTFQRIVPKRMLPRFMRKAGGMIIFKENIWLIIKQQLYGARRACNRAKNTHQKTITVTEDTIPYPDDEDQHVERMTVMISSPLKTEEDEEYDACKKLYMTLGSIVSKSAGIQKLDKKLPGMKEAREMFNKGHEAGKKRTAAETMLSYAGIASELKRTKK